MKKHTNIRKSLITSISLLALFPMLAAMTFSLLMFHHEISDRIRLDNEKVAQTVAMAVDLFTARPVVMLRQIRDEVDEDVDVSLRKLSAIANDTLSVDPIFESIMFINAGGELVGVAGEGGAPVPRRAEKKNFSQDYLLKKIKEGRDTAWSEPFVSLKSGESVISIAIPWRQGGMISGTMNLSYLCKLVAPTRTSKNAYAFIVSPEGRLVAHPDRTLVGEKEAFISTPQILAGFHGEIGTDTFMLQDRMVIGSVLPFSQNDWVIVSVHDKGIAYASLYQMEFFLGLLTLVVLSGSLYFAIRRGDQIASPIIALTKTTRQIASGETPFEHDTTSEYEEIRELRDNFQMMATAVAERERELQRRNDKLIQIEGELRHQVEEYLHTYDALLSEKVKLESILANMGEGLSIQDRDYRVVLQNQAHREMVGDAVGQYCYQAYRHSDAICDECPMKLAFEDGKLHSTLRRIERDGDECFLEISVSPLRNAHFEIIGGIEIVRDVTDRERAAGEIMRLNQELEARVLERTADLEIANQELESFSYSVSHDLRAPLRHISSFSSILEREYSDRLDSDARYYLSRILAGCEKMVVLIDDLLELSQVTRIQLRRSRVDLSRIGQVIAASLVENEPDRKVVFRIEEGLETSGDERLLEVLLTNLFSNAWKYSSRAEESVIELGSRLIAARPVFFVKDNGVGFDKTYADKLFTPFQRLHGSEFEGTGVGLAIVQRIVQRHGGKVWADATVGEGATFYFTIRS